MEAGQAECGCSSTTLGQCCLSASTSVSCTCNAYQVQLNTRGGAGGRNALDRWNTRRQTCRRRSLHFSREKGTQFLALSHCQMKRIQYITVPAVYLEYGETYEHLRLLCVKALEERGGGKLGDEHPAGQQVAGLKEGGEQGRTVQPQACQLCAGIQVE